VLATAGYLSLRSARRHSSLMGDRWRSHKALSRALHRFL
jgi:hypothetical protein